jgi:lipopolysaccharide export system permease protein
LKKLDWYILRKFLGTFFYAITLIVLIAVIFDISEKIDDFLDKKAPLKEIIFGYYLNFIPYFANLFSPLFTFIAVIFFTSKMASQTEIVAILSSGVSFKRMMRPYMIAATFLAVLSFTLNNFVIPRANEKRLAFEETYIRNKFMNTELNIHRQIEPGVFIYFESYNNLNNTGYRFSLEKIKDGILSYKLMADMVRWDSVKSQWQISDYHIRTINGVDENLITGKILDTTLAFYPKEFGTRLNNVETMNLYELNAFIDKEKMKGSDNVEFYEIEKYNRIALPFATFVLTIIGVSLACRKVRGGIGLHIGLGIILSFAYILFMQISNTFATYSNVPTYLAVWIPNIIFSFIALYIYRTAPK